MRKISKFSAVLLIVIASLTVATTVLCAVLWSLSVPTTISITSSVNAELYADVSCTIPLTEISLDSIDRLDTTTWSTSQTIYLKYVGSEENSMDLTLLSYDFPSGFKAEWSYFGTWHALGETETRDFTQEDVTDLQVRVRQLETHDKGDYSFSFDFTIQDS